MNKIFGIGFYALIIGCTDAQVVKPIHPPKPSLEIKVDTIAFNDKNYLLGKLNYEDYKGSFVLMTAPYANTSNLYLRKDAWNAFANMADDAKKEGISLTIISGARNYQRQSRIWENKWNGEVKVQGKNLATDVKDPAERAKMILLFSSMPGTSRHHWGTDIDINSLEDSYFQTPKGKNEYQWLVKNASKYGFYQPYTVKGTDRNSGYEEEKWHWTYMPVAGQLLKNYIALITLDDIHSFKGHETAKSLDVINKYVLGISPTCK